MVHEIPSNGSTLPMDIDALQDALGYHFQFPHLLIQALTHPSYYNEHPEELGGDNQRLEFLGDAVLDFVAGLWVYNHYPEFQEGPMTRLRAALVRTETLSEWARLLRIDQALRLGKGEEATGGRVRQANLCDAFEAVIGAMYLDGSIPPVKRLAESLIEPAAKRITSTHTDWDAKSRLQEWSQAQQGITPHYRIVEERGPDHAKTFIAEVVLGNRVAGQGGGHSKQSAEQAAAQTAWREISGQ